MTGTGSLHVTASVEGIRAAIAGLDAFSAAAGLSPGALWPFQVALDEVLSNVAKYGQRATGGPALVEIQIRLVGDNLEIVLWDDARPFDPLAARPPDLAQPVQGRPLGGLGIALVRKLMHVVEYERSGNRNRLLMSRRLEPGGHERGPRGI
jgi:serine/threonine-protein kinase RsbW